VIKIAKQFLLNPFVLMFCFLAIQYILLQLVCTIERPLFALAPFTLPELTVTIITVLLVWLFWCRIQKRSLIQAGLDGKNALQETVLGFFLGFIVSAAAVLCMTLYGTYQLHTIGPIRANLGEALLAMLLVAINEELMFRVFIFHTFERRWGTIVALVITATIFGLLHMINNIPAASMGQQLCGCLYLIPEAGFLLNAAFLMRRRIWLPLGLHWAWNFFEGPIFGTYVSGTNLGAPLMHAKVAGPFWATGGPFGPEASVFGLLTGTAIGALLAWYAIKYGSWRQVPAEEAKV